MSEPEVVPIRILKMADGMWSVQLAPLLCIEGFRTFEEASVWVLEWCSRMIQTAVSDRTRRSIAEAALEAKRQADAARLLAKMRNITDDKEKQ